MERGAALHQACKNFGNDLRRCLRSRIAPLLVLAIAKEKLNKAEPIERGLRDKILEFMEILAQIPHTEWGEKLRSHCEFRPDGGGIAKCFSTVFNTAKVSLQRDEQKGKTPRDENKKTPVEQASAKDLPAFEIASDNEILAYLPTLISFIMTQPGGNIYIDHHANGTSLRELAKEHGMTLANVRKIITHIQKRLKNYKRK